MNHNIIFQLNYTTGNLEVAKNYFCYALTKNKNSYRALWGLLQTIKKLNKYLKSVK